MAQYELVREIPNLCRNNQMRDIFFSEVETPSPVQYVQNFLNDSHAELTVCPGFNGCVTIFAVADGFTQLITCHAEIVSFRVLSLTQVIVNYLESGLAIVIIGIENNKGRIAHGFSGAAWKAVFLGERRANAPVAPGK